MRVLRLLIPLVLVAGCQSTTGVAPGQVSCQPVGMSPAPITFSFAPGALTAASAQESAVAMIRACGSMSLDAGPGAMDPGTLTSTVEESKGELPGPNGGRDVWLVRIDARVKSGIGEMHYLVEVNKETGVPTLVAIG